MDKKKNIIALFTSLLFCVLWIFLMRNAFFSQLPGMFRTSHVPDSYKSLESFLNRNNSFSRTIWIPSLQRFGYTSMIHPAVSATDLLYVQSATQAAQIIGQIKNQQLLRDAGIQYIIVPYDSQGELFLKDRKYDESQYLETIALLRSTNELRELNGFGKIHVFETRQRADRFRFTDRSALNWVALSPSHYQIKPKNATMQGRLIFSESFGKGWVAQVGNKTIFTEKYANRFNSFDIPMTNKSIDIFYRPQLFVNIGLVISGLTIVSICLILLKII